MEIINKSNFPLSKIEKIIRFVRPPNIKVPKVYIRSVTSLTFNGYFDWEKDKIYAAIGEYYHFPILVYRDTDAKRKGYLSQFDLNNREEALVYVLAHELRHKWQFQYPNERRLGDCYMWRLFSERDTDTYALWKLENWRKKKKKSSVAKNGKKALNK